MGNVACKWAETSPDIARQPPLDHPKRRIRCTHRVRCSLFQRPV